MSLTQALLTSAAGLRATQANLALVSANVANSETPNYARKTLSVTSDASGGVRTGAVNRQLDQYVQRQLRVEMAGGSYAGLRAQFYDRLQGLYGQPGADGTLESTFSDFTTALQALNTSPDASSARSSVLNAASVLTQQLNTMSAAIQGLRSDAESGLSDSVQSANDAMQQIARINRQLAGSTQGDTASAVLMDERDRYVDQLSQLMDIRVLDADNNQISVFTNSGVQLVGSTASQLKFDPQGTMTPNTQWSADPNERMVGTITLVSPNGDGIDMLANKSIRSGTIAAYLEMRDDVLVAAQSQLDTIAAAMSQALSDKTTPGSAASAGAQNGFDVDLAGLLPGNSVRVTYTDVATNTQRTVTLVRVDDAAALPLTDNATMDPNDRVVGINFSGGMASVVSQIGAALGSDLTVSNPSGNTLRVLDDGGADVAMQAMATTKTTTGLSTGSVEIPLFVDGGTPYTGAFTSGGNQMTGLAGRISVNGAVLADPSKLIAYGPATPAGDASRPAFILAQLSQTTLTFAPESGIGTTNSPFRASLPSFLREVLSNQGAAAANASSLKEGQDVVVNALKQRATETSGVNIDEEMTHLLQLQSAYAANARVMSAVKEMLDLLSRI